MLTDQSENSHSASNSLHVPRAERAGASTKSMRGSLDFADSRELALQDSREWENHQKRVSKACCSLCLPRAPS